MPRSRGGAQSAGRVSSSVPTFITLEGLTAFDTSGATSRMLRYSSDRPAWPEGYEPNRRCHGRTAYAAYHAAADYMARISPVAAAHAPILVWSNGHGHWYAGYYYRQGSMMPGGAEAVGTPAEAAASATVTTALGWSPPNRSDGQRSEGVNMRDYLWCVPCGDTGELGCVVCQEAVLQELNRLQSAAFGSGGPQRFVNTRLRSLNAWCERNGIRPTFLMAEMTCRGWFEVAGYVLAAWGGDALDSLRPDNSGYTAFSTPACPREAHRRERELRERAAAEAIRRERERAEKRARMKTFSKKRAALIGASLDELSDGLPYAKKGPGPGPKRLVGLEVEFNRNVYGGRTTTDWRDTWEGASVVSDGSCGLEAVTPPLAGECLRACVEDICDILNKGAGGCNERCSVHVHVDARDFSWDDMSRLIRVYQLVEPILYILGGQGRVTNHYCRPLGTRYSAVLEADYDKADKRMRVLQYASVPVREGRSKKGGDRYRGMNLLPWLAGKQSNAKDSTVEFRIHKNSHDPQRLVPWATLLSDLVSWVACHNDREADALPKGALRALVAMLPTHREYILARLREWKNETTANSAYPSSETGFHGGTKAVKPVRTVRVTGNKGVWSCAA
jgi:hypothetical protein